METRRLVLVLTGIAVVLIVVIGGLSLALLAGGEDSGGSGGGNQQPDGSPLPERLEGELRLFGPDPITLDPACAADAGSAEYIVEIFSGLVSFDRDLKLVPDVASSWDVSDDGKTYTFHLRPNVLFHDRSRRVTAGDFKFSMERSLDPDTQSTVGDVYLDDIAGAREFADGKADEVSGIKVIDEDTLELDISQPSSVFVEKLSYPTAYVVDRNEVKGSTCFEGGNWTLKPNGTGPFRLKEWVLGQRLELEPNSQYYLDPKPALSRVTYVLSGGSPLVMYENDEIDITGVGINDIESVRDPNNPLNKEYSETPSLDVFYIGFNAQQAPFDDPKVRQALNMAVDRDFLANDLLAELVLPANGVLPPGMPGYNEGLDGLPFDPDRARQLLDEAGGPEILTDVKLLASGQGASPSQVLEAVVAMWQDNLGVTVTVEQEDFGLFLRDIDQGTFQIFSLGWVADYPDPQNFLDIKFHSQSGNNETKYASSRVDSLLDQARTEKDEQKRLDLYRQAEETIVQDSPWIPLYHGKASVLTKPYVKGYFIPPFVINNLRYVSITE
ncbi:MAG: peptide ABC transporter substrate-binding protein [Dehalococcoidia bacterium]|nr:peptide ABC transporter substrate-binding protein [Dehalococcoidia bacterium]